MRFTVRCVRWELFHVIDTERADLVVSSWHTMAGALANAAYRNRLAA